MGTVLIAKRGIASSREIKSIQKAYLKQHRKVRGRFPKGKMGKVVALVNDEYIDCTQKDQMQDLFDCNKLSPQDIWYKLKEAEIRGLSGSNFPTIKKLETVRKALVSEKYFIINGVSCDPGLLHDAWLIRTHREEINTGIELIKKLINFNKVILATPDDVPNRYPMGEERILIKTLLKQEIEEKEIPAEKGILVLNVQTVYALYKAVTAQEEKVTRYLTVADLTTGKAKVAKAYLGQAVSEILLEIKAVNEKEKFICDMNKSYVGSGIMDAEPIGEEDKISAATGFIGFGEAYAFENEAKCKGCGTCTRKCPRGIKVHKVIKAIEKGNWTELEQYHIERCMKCGTCSYYCIAGKNLMEIIEKAKERQNEK